MDYCDIINNIDPIVIIGRDLVNIVGIIREDIINVFYKVIVIENWRWIFLNKSMISYYGGIKLVNTTVSKTHNSVLHFHCFFLCDI